MIVFDWLNVPAAQMASNPLWHPVEKSLYWSDTISCRLYRYNPAEGTTQVVLEDGRPVGAMTLQADGSLLLFRDQANIVTFRDGAISETIINGIADYRQTCFVSAIADKAGRVICAVSSDSHHTGRLLLLERNGHLSLLEDGFSIPAGLAFSADGTTLYFNDSHETRQTTWQYRYDCTAENPISEAPLIYHSGFTEARSWLGYPSGVALSQDGSLWISRRDGAMVVHHNAPGEPAESVRLAVRKPLGICFGGEDLTDLFVTTGGGHRKSLEGLHAGEVAAIHSVGPGVLPFTSRIRLSDDIVDVTLATPVEENPEVIVEEATDMPAAEGEEAPTPVETPVAEIGESQVIEEKPGELNQSNTASEAPSADANEAEAKEVSTETPSEEAPTTPPPALFQPPTKPSAGGFVSL